MNFSSINGDKMDWLFHDLRSDKWSYYCKTTECISFH